MTLDDPCGSRDTCRRGALVSQIPIEIMNAASRVGVMSHSPSYALTARLATRYTPLSSAGVTR